MAYNWLKWFHGAVADDKWPLVARKSGQPVAVVVAVWAALLECASQAEDRGSIEDFDAESMDAVLQIPDGACAAIVEALSTGKRPRIVDGRINNWEKRQEEPQQSSSTERVRRFRERKRAHNAGDEATCNAGETPETACNADETFHSVSCSADETVKRPDKRLDKNLNISPPQVNNLKYKDARVAKTVPDGEGEGREEPVLPDENFDFGFAQAWDAYPAERRGPAADAVIAWKGLARARDLPGLPILLEAITKWEDSGQWRRENGRFIPHFANFLRRRMWEQEPPPDSAGAARPKSARDEQAETMDRWAREILEEERRQKEAEAV